MITSKFEAVGMGSTSEVYFGPLARGDVFRGVVVSVVNPGNATFDAGDGIEISLCETRSMDGGERVSAGVLPIPKAVGQSLAVPCQFRLRGRLFVGVRLSGGSVAWGGVVSIIVERMGAQAGGQGKAGSGIPVSGLTATDSASPVGV